MTATCTSLHWQSTRCVDCHTPMSTVKSLAISHEIQGKDKAVKNCVACHATDSQLAARLYRYASANASADLGFANPGVLGSAYVVGATRNPWLDKALLALFALTIAGVLAHGLIRLFAAMARKGRG